MVVNIYKLNFLQVYNPFSVRAAEVSNQKLKGVDLPRKLKDTHTQPFAWMCLHQDNAKQRNVGKPE